MPRPRSGPALKEYKRELKAKEAESRRNVEDAAERIRRNQHVRGALAAISPPPIKYKARYRTGAVVSDTHSQRSLARAFKDAEGIVAALDRGRPYKMLADFKHATDLAKERLHAVEAWARENMQDWHYREWVERYKMTALHFHQHFPWPEYAQAASGTQNPHDPYDINDPEFW